MNSKKHKYYIINFDDKIEERLSDFVHYKVPKKDEKKEIISNFAEFSNS
jgi:hypothetical protein